MLTENDIRRIIWRIADRYAPLAVGAFGSYAIGSPGKRSDLDLFLIKDSNERSDARACAVRRLLFDVQYPVDVHVFTPEEFEDTVYEELSFTWVISRQARLYHWTDEASRRLPSLRSRAESLIASARGT